MEGSAQRLLRMYQHLRHHFYMTTQRVLYLDEYHAFTIIFTVTFTVGSSAAND